MTRLASLALLLASLGSAGCRRDPRWCDDRPGNFCGSFDAPSDTPGRCTSSADCAAPTPACDISGSMTCVQCVAPDQLSACTGTTPACGSDHVCRACKAHSECASSACLDDGSCASESEVAYVDPAGTDNAVCSKAMPCTKVAKALATNRPYVKFRGTTNEQVTINNQNVTLLADPGAKLTEANPGVILNITGTSVVAIFDLAIADALGSTGVGISMPTGNAATLKLRRVTITGNSGGGISITGGQFDIMNTIIAKNGSVTSSFGGVLVQQTDTGMRNFAFNTVTENGGTTNSVTGVTCVLVNQPVTFSNNIVYGNQVSGTGKQVGGGGMCTWAYSDIGPDGVTGNNNINADPMFVNAAQGDFHIGASSPCRDAADPGATLDSDIDRDTRPQGAARDIGADEAK